MFLFNMKVIVILNVVIFFCFGVILLLDVFWNFYVMVRELKVFIILFNVLVKMDEFLVFLEVMNESILNIIVMSNEVMEVIKVVWFYFLWNFWGRNVLLGVLVFFRYDM